MAFAVTCVAETSVALFFFFPEYVLPAAPASLCSRMELNCDGLALNLAVNLQQMPVDGGF